MEAFIKQHGTDDVQALFSADYKTDDLFDGEKEDIRNVLKIINRAGRSLIDTGTSIYLVDHSDKEGIENRDRKKGQEGF